MRCVKDASSKAVGGADPVPITFRYRVGPKESQVTNVYKPKEAPPAESGADGVKLKSSSLGAVFANNFHKVINNMRASVLFEASKWAMK